MLHYKTLSEGRRYITRGISIAKQILANASFHWLTCTSLNQTVSTKSLTETRKLSYSCMPNVKTIISSHNKSESNKPEQTDVTKNCNYRYSKACPMGGNCKEKGITYTKQRYQHQLPWKHTTDYVTRHLT